VLGSVRGWFIEREIGFLGWGVGGGYCSQEDLGGHFKLLEIVGLSSYCCLQVLLELRSSIVDLRKCCVLRCLVLEG
jgi:hypothetical protein